MGDGEQVTNVDGAMLGGCRHVQSGCELPLIWGQELLYMAERGVMVLKRCRPEAANVKDLGDMSPVKLRRDRLGSTHRRNTKASESPLLYQVVNNY